MGSSAGSCPWDWPSGEAALLRRDDPARRPSPLLQAKQIAANLIRVDLRARAVNVGFREQAQFVAAKGEPLGEHVVGVGAGSDSTGIGIGGASAR